MKEFIFFVLFQLQKILFFIFYAFFKLFSTEDKKTYVVGVEETAGILRNMTKALKQAISVNLIPHRFYQYDYDFTFRNESKIKKLIFGPIIFAKLAAKYNKFIYISGAGYLIATIDGREFELNFLNKRSKEIICYFTGTDVRSYKLLTKYAKEKNIEVLIMHEPLDNPGVETPEREKKREQLANSADRFATHIFNPAIDQMSYFTRKTHAPVYFYPDERFVKNDQKFEKIEEIKILHAPSSPNLKGTPKVREAISKLEKEGYKFNYVELINVDNKKVLEELRSAHIVLNQFYAFLPGVFGIEALAAHTTLLTSADETIEPALPAGANSAWMVTSYATIYDNLKKLLDDPSLLKPQADYGFDWGKEQYSYTASARKFRSAINANE